MTNKPKPFQIQVAQETLDNLQAHFSLTRWPTTMAASHEWENGTSVPYMQSFVEHWQSKYDWRAWEQRINRFDQYLWNYDVGQLHYLIEQGSGSNPTPILLTHGWPGSFVEFINMIEPLAHPERFGGNIDDAFTVVVPSLPGYGFSTGPSKVISPRETAMIFHQLMKNVLGFDQFIAHGGDMGSSICSWLALDYQDALLGLHLNNVVMNPQWTIERQPLTGAEQEFLMRLEQRLDGETAYQLLHASKPMTLAFSTINSPVGLAAWMLEKFHNWTVGEQCAALMLDKDHLITNIMLHWLGDPGAASWMYRYLLDMSSFTMPGQRYIEVPTGLCLFPNDCCLVPPLSWTQRIFSAAQMTLSKSGGHFPAIEQPGVLLKDIRQFSNQIK